MTSALDVGLYSGTAARTRVRLAFEIRDRGPHGWVDGIEIGRARTGESVEPTLDAAIAG